MDDGARALICGRGGAIKALAIQEQEEWAPTLKSYSIDVRVIRNENGHKLNQAYKTTLRRSIWLYSLYGNIHIIIYIIYGQYMASIQLY